MAGAQNYATQSKTGPNPASTAHLHGGGSTSYTCHMAAIHWAFMDHGDNQGAAQKRMEAIIQATCIPCVNNNPDLRHGSISPQWYGTNFCGGAQRILNRAAL